MKLEKRMIVANFEIREGEAGSTLVAGLAVPFNKLSEDLGGFRERIAPDAFDIEAHDIKALWSHDTSKVIGSTKAKTLSLEERSNGIHFELEPGDTTTGRDAVKTIQRGDVDGVSFGFKVDEDRIDQIDGEVIRTVLRGKLIEISPVAFPSYLQTQISAELRSRIESFVAQEEPGSEEPTEGHKVAILEAELGLLEVE